jgi:hypothetical protein
VEALAGQFPRGALQAVAVEVLAREVDQDFLAGVNDRTAEGHRAELRVAAGVVGDGNAIDRVAADELSGESADVARLGVSIVPRADANSTPSKNRRFAPVNLSAKASMSWRWASALMARLADCIQ